MRLLTVLSDSSARCIVRALAESEPIRQILSKLARGDRQRALIRWNEHRQATQSDSGSRSRPISGGTMHGGVRIFFQKRN